MDKLIEEITTLGCESKEDATLCALTYLELLRRQDKQTLSDTTFHFNGHIKKAYCQTRVGEKSGPMKLFVPISSSLALNPQIWDDYFALITDIHIPNCVVLVIWEADSTFVFYEISKGLGSPPNKKSNKQSRRKKSMVQKKVTEVPELKRQKDTSDVPGPSTES